MWYSMIVWRISISQQGIRRTANGGNQSKWQCRHSTEKFCASGRFRLDAQQWPIRASRRLWYLLRFTGDTRRFRTSLQSNRPLFQPKLYIPGIYCWISTVHWVSAENLSNPAKSVRRGQRSTSHNPTTYIEEWNLNIEQQFGKNSVFQLAYVGTHGVHLSYIYNLNQATEPLDSNFGPAPNYGRPYFATVPNIAAIRTNSDIADSISHQLQAKFEKRFSSGWSVLNAYTWQPQSDNPRRTMGWASECKQPSSRTGDQAPDFETNLVLHGLTHCRLVLGSVTFMAPGECATLPVAGKLRAFPRCIRERHLLLRYRMIHRTHPLELRGPT